MVLNAQRLEMNGGCAKLGVIWSIISKDFSAGCESEHADAGLLHFEVDAAS